MIEAALAIALFAIFGYGQRVSAQGANAPADVPGIPDTWRELPRVAEAAESAGRQVGAAGGSEQTFSIRAWGDPASGCFLILADVAVAGEVAGANPASIHDELAEAMGQMGFDVGGRGTAAADPSTRSQLTFAADSLRGTIRTRARIAAVRGDSALRVTSAACFYSPREPEQSARVCARFLSQLEELP